LGIGRVYTYASSCSFVVGDEKGIRVLLHIFDNYNINGIKYLDYKDFRRACRAEGGTPSRGKRARAFLLYFDRRGALTDEIRSEILELYNGSKLTLKDLILVCL
jgi:hypothetical protein